MPFAYGGGVKKYEDFERLYTLGVEKVIINSLIQENPAIIKKVVDNYGAQALVACVDFKKPLFGEKAVYSYIGHKIKYSLKAYVKYLTETIGVGELMLQSADRDGTWEGYDEEVIDTLINLCNVPVIACGGAGTAEHLKAILYKTNANAAAIGSMAVYSKKGMGVLINFPERATIIKE
jgi:cyclase